MKIIALNDAQRNKIVKLVKPDKKSLYSWQNLDLLTAVSDDSGKYVLTMAYYLSASIRRTDDIDDEYKFVLLTKLGGFMVSGRENAGKYSGFFSPLPFLISNKKLKEMIEFYFSCVSERRSLRKQLLSEMNFEGNDFTEWFWEKNTRK